MARRPNRGDPEHLRQSMIDRLREYRDVLENEDLRTRVQAFVPVLHEARDLGMSLNPDGVGGSARRRILDYFLLYPRIPLAGDELLVVSGIGEWARRVRELRVEEGWPIATGPTLREMAAENELPDDLENLSFATDEYVLLDRERDEDAARRWKMANSIRRENRSMIDKLLDYFRRNVGRELTGDELRYVAGDHDSWARRTRQLRTEFGWPVATQATGRPDLAVGVYVLEADRQAPAHDRAIKDNVRRDVLRRDDYRCQKCGWTHDLWNPSDPRHLEAHHIKRHVDGGSNEVDNLVTLCQVCHDATHSGG